MGITAWVELIVGPFLISLAILFSHQRTNVDQGHSAIYKDFETLKTKVLIQIAEILGRTELDN